jgi:hypothetical protein
VALYRLVLNEEAARFFAEASRPGQRQLSGLFDALKKLPSTLGDLREKDQDGRDNEIIVKGDWIITFWVDHASREVRIVRLENVQDSL